MQAFGSTDRLPPGTGRAPESGDMMESHPVTNPLTIVVSGMIAADPYQGGATWAVLQYLLGFRRLGHDVYFIEPIPASSLRPVDAPFEASVNATYFRDVMRDFGFDGRASLLLAGTAETVGLGYSELRTLAARADLLVNTSGLLTDPELMGPVPTRVYLDLDPAFNQFWHDAEGIDRHYTGHTHFVTVGQLIGEPACLVPDCGYPWLPSLPPVVLEQWPVIDDVAHDGLTTVGNWRGYGSVEVQGVFYGQKAHSVRQFITLPTLTREPVLVAFAIHPGETRDLEALRANGWRLLDPSAEAGDPARYRRFVQQSKAELGIAKQGYVVSRCGWFSDRSASYLAAGRPVIAQETGWSEVLPTGSGLLVFSTMAELLSAIDELNRDYLFHRRAARRLAEQYLDSDRVLGHFLHMVGMGE